MCIQLWTYDCGCSYFESLVGPGGVDEAASPEQIICETMYSDVPCCLHLLINESARTVLNSISVLCPHRATCPARPGVAGQGRGVERGLCYRFPTPAQLCAGETGPDAGRFETPVLDQPARMTKSDGGTDLSETEERVNDGTEVIGRLHLLKCNEIFPPFLKLLRRYLTEEHGNGPCSSPRQHNPRGSQSGIRPPMGSWLAYEA